MPRNLDLTALRSFVTVADTGGVTRAAGLLNLTQSAVSMQLKRLEESLGRTLLDRSGRGISLTADGEQLVSRARRLLELNDEIVEHMTGQKFEGEIVLGVPHDIVYPAIPKVLRHIHRKYPRIKVTLISSMTRLLRDQFARGECDVILTTEQGLMPGGETLTVQPLVWVGAPGGTAWKERPLRLAYERSCMFRRGVQEALDRAGIGWEMAVESDSARSIDASVGADLAVQAVIEGTEPPGVKRIAHGGALPDLGEVNINLYRAETCTGPVADTLLALLRQNYGALQASAPASAAGRRHDDLAGGLSLAQ